MECIIDESRGIYIPFEFAKRYGHLHQNKEEITILLKGPDEEAYWDVWDSVLQSFSTEEGLILFQEGNLFLVDPNKLKDIDLTM